MSGTAHWQRGDSQGDGVMTLLRCIRIVSGLALIALAAACGPGSKTVPADPKARTEFMATTAAKLKPDERILLERFIQRVDAQTAATGKPLEVSVSRAIELQRGFETKAGETHVNLRTLQDQAKAVVTIDVSDTKVIVDEKSKPPGGKSLRYVVNVTNHGTRVIESVSLRLDFREASGKYLAAIPELQLTGKLLPGDVGRLAQTLPLNPQRHQYILEGQAVQIIAFPTRIAFVGGEVLEPGKAMQALETLHRAKIE